MLRILPCQNFSLILVLQNSNKQNSDITWQRYKLNLRNSLLLEECFLVMGQVDCTLSSVIDSTLGLRCRSFGYRYSEIIRLLMSKGMLWAEVVYSSLNLSDNSVRRGRVHARRTLKGLVADLRVIERAMLVFSYFQV